MPAILTRYFLRCVCRTLIGVVLLAQLAVAAYACPGLAAAVATPMAAVAATGDEQADTVDGDTAHSTADHSMVNCAGMAGMMDPDFANLCAAHCQHGQQSDQAATLTVPAVLLTALYTITPLAPAPAVAPHPAAHATRALAAAPPPHTILHCCFRI